MSDQKHKISSAQVKVFGAVAIPAMAADLAFLHGASTPAGLVLSGVAAYLIAKHGPDVYALAEGILPRPTHQEHIVTSVPGKRTVKDRLMGRYPVQEIGDDAITEQLPVERTRLLPENQQATRRLPDEDEEYINFDDEYEDAPPSVLGSAKSGMFTLSQLLASGFRPTLKKIFLARLMDGTDIFVEAKDLCHVALAGNTGNGKSSLMRLIMAQLCMIRVDVLLLNPHYMRLDRSANPPEDWTPFEPYLKQPPIPCANFEQIGFYLKWMAETLLPKRVERARNGGGVGKPYFIIIDEVPAIVKKVEEAPEYISAILREGRKYGIFLICASQDFQVKTIGMDGGGVRKCFRTAFYVGGDMATAKALLEKSAGEIPETSLGKGTVMIRCKATQSAVLAKVPYVDNESLYKMLGPSTFNQGNQEEEEEDDELAPVNGQKVAQPVTQKQEMTMEDILTYLASRPEVDPYDTRYGGDQPEPARLRVVPTTPVISPEEQQLQDAIQAYREGATSQSKMAAAMGISPWDARQLMAKVLHAINQDAHQQASNDD